VLQRPKAGGDVVKTGASTGREIYLPPHQDLQKFKGNRQSTKWKSIRDFSGSFFNRYLDRDENFQIRVWWKSSQNRPANSV